MNIKKYEEEVAIAAPSILYLGIKSQLSIMFVMAPKIMIFVNIFGLPIPERICPFIFDMAKNIIPTERILKGETAERYLEPKKRLMINSGKVRKIKDIGHIMIKAYL